MSDNSNHITAPGMLAAMAIISARKMSLEKQVTTEEYIKVMETEMADTEPVIVMSALASLCYSFMKAKELDAQGGVTVDQMIFKISSELQSHKAE